MGKHPNRWQLWILLVGLVAAIVAPTVYVLLNRLDDQVLTIIATVGCAAGVSIPALIAAMIVLIKRAESSGSNGRNDGHPRAEFTQPVLMMVPPMQIPQQPTMQVPMGVPTTLTREPITERRFTIVGEE